MTKKIETYLVDILYRQKCESAILKYSETPSRISIESNSINQIKVEGIDLLECYQKLQKILEEKGYLLSLTGSRIDVQASGFLRDSTNGISTYQFTDDFNSEKPVLNIFHSSPIDRLGTIEEHKQFFKEWKTRYKAYMQGENK